MELQKKSVRVEEDTVQLKKDLMTGLDETLSFNPLSSYEVQELVMQNMQNVPMSAQRNMRMVTVDDVKLQQALDLMDNEIEDWDITDVEYEQPDEPQPCTDLAIISQELRASGVSNVRWTPLKCLPGVADREIRKIGKLLFQGYDASSMNDIYCMASVQGNDLLNSALEMNSVLHFLENHAEKPYGEAIGIQRFHDIFGEYDPEIKVFKSEDRGYLVVNEPEGHGFSGQYIYSFKLKG